MSSHPYPKEDPATRHLGLPLATSFGDFASGAPNRQPLTANT